MGIINNEIGNSSKINNIFIEISTDYEKQFLNRLQDTDISFKVMQRYNDSEEDISIIEVYIPLFVDKKSFWHNLSVAFVYCIKGRPRIVESTAVN